MKCRACGKEFDEGRYCPYCGTPVDSEPVRTERTVEKKKSNRIVGYNWVVVLVIAAMLIVFFLKTPKYGQKLYGTWQVTELVAEGMDSNSDEDGLYWYAYNSLFKEGTKVEFNKDGTMIIGGRVCKYKVVDNQNIDITVDSEVRAQWGFWEKDRNKLLLDFDIPGGKLIQVQMYRPENIPVETGGSSTNENSAEDGIENEEKSATTNADENVYIRTNGGNVVIGDRTSNNNYVKAGMMDKPSGKKYSRESLAQLLMIVQLKLTTPMDLMKTLLLNFLFYHPLFDL